jgi:hypothetical protein
MGKAPAPAAEAELAAARDAAKKTRARELADDRATTNAQKPPSANVVDGILEGMDPSSLSPRRRPLTSPLPPDVVGCDSRPMDSLRCSERRAGNVEVICGH